MAFDIPTFSENISTYGLSFSSKFDVQIIMPPIFSTLSQSDYPYIQQFNKIQPFRAKAVSTPGAGFLTNETHPQGIGYRIKQVYNAGFPDIRMTFLGDAGGVIENFFTLWMNVVYNYSFSAGSSATFYTNYRSQVVSPNIIINKYDRQKNIISTYNITNALPTLFISPVLDWENQNALNYFTAGFHYTSYTIL